MFPVWAYGVISKVVTLVVNAFEFVGAGFVFPGFESRGLVFSFALQHQAISLWCSSLWGLLHFWHFEP